MARLDAGWTRLELALCAFAGALLMLSLSAWVVLTGLAQPSVAFRAVLGAVVLGALAGVVTRRKAAVLVALVAGAAVAPVWREAGVAWCSNLLGWLQDGSTLTLAGGLRGVGTRLTLWLALLGGSLATAAGRHVTIDVVSRALGPRLKVPLAILGGLVSAAVCLGAAWGFTDFIARDGFGARESVAGPLAAGLSLQAFVVGEQLQLDARVAARVLGGQRWDTALTAAEWNERLADGGWEARYGAAAVALLREGPGAPNRAPLIAIPGAVPQSFVVRGLNLIVPFGLLMIALRMLLWCLRRAPVEPGEARPSPPARRWPGWVALSATAAASSAMAGLTAGTVAVGAAIGVPLFAVMAGAAELAWLSTGAPLNRLAPKVLEEQFAGSPVLVTIPLFIFLGYVLAESQAPRRIVAAAQALLGWMPGGLAIVCLVASAFFTTLTGGSGVTIVAIGGLLLPALLRQGYPERFSIGLVTTGGSLGLLFPPSLPILVYGLVAGLDFLSAFKAGVLPGLLVLVLLAGWAAWVGFKAKIPLERPSGRAMAAALWEVKWELGLPVLLLGALGLSLASLDEAAALGALYTLAVALFVHRDLKWSDLPRVLKSSVALAGAVVLILMMANALMNFVIDQQVPARVLEALASAGLTERWQFLIALNLFLLVIGMLMDGFSAILVAVPLVLPFAARFGLQPFHLAMMFILNLELAFSAPPLGLNLFIASFRFGRPVASLYRAVLPFVGLLALALGVVMAVPWLSTALVQGDVEAARAQAERLGVPPREAWVLECVQVDPTHPHPCSEEDRRRFGSPDAGATDEDDALLKQLLEP